MNLENFKYSDILEANRKLGKNMVGKSYKVAILSNITVNLIEDILEYSLRIEGINVGVWVGNYNNIVQDSLKYKDSRAVIIFWELCNIIDGLPLKIELLSDKQFDELIETVKSEIDLVLKNLEKTSLVLINKFTPLLFSNSHLMTGRLDQLGAILNQYLEDRKTKNVKLVNLEKIIASIGIEPSIDLRYYYSSKAFYTIDFFKAYAEYIKPFIMSANGKSKKAIIFDCDNTLWKGVLGEEGFDKIEMSPKTSDGAVFSEIQNIALALGRQGILIGLCSKNNYEDVLEVINSHPDMQLRDEHIAIKKINWSNKAVNLREIARELNIGLDSLVYVDDSAFEINLIKEQLPEVTVLQVPTELYNYPKLLRQNIGLFYSLSLTKEDSLRTEMYRQQIKRKNAKHDFSNIEDYLSSIELKMVIYENEGTLISRMSQISQKTNQFNLTTKRYTDEDIRIFITNNDSKVFAFSVSDKFGDSGVTGLCIVTFDYKLKRADIDTFLMSCRIIGRNVEYAFMDYLIDFIKNNNIKTVTAKYIETPKNMQSKEFYDQCSFSLLESSDSVRYYSLDVNRYQPKNIKYIEVANGK